MEKNWIVFPQTMGRSLFDPQSLLYVGLPDSILPNYGLRVAVKPGGRAVHVIWTYGPKYLMLKNSNGNVDIIKYMVIKMAPGISLYLIFGSLNHSGP